MTAGADDAVVELTLALFRQAASIGTAATDETGLAPTDVRGLRALDHLRRAPVPVGELGRRLGLSSAATTGLVDRLEGAGLAERRRDGGDRRRVLVALTPRALAFGTAHLSPVMARVRAAAAQLDAEGRREVARYLRSVIGEDAGDVHGPTGP